MRSAPVVTPSGAAFVVDVSPRTDKLGRALQSRASDQADGVLGALSLLQRLRHRTLGKDLWNVTVVNLDGGRGAPPAQQLGVTGRATAERTAADVIAALKAGHLPPIELG